MLSLVVSMLALRPNGPLWVALEFYHDRTPTRPIRDAFQ